MGHRRRYFRQECALPILTLFLFLLSMNYFPLSAGSVLADFKEILVPLGMVGGLTVVSARLLRGAYEADQSKQMALYGWMSALVASCSVLWFIQRLQQELTMSLVFNEGLTVVSVASAIGVFVGAHVATTQRLGRHTKANRDRLLTETVWTTASPPNPILSVITAQLAELENTHPAELKPLYDHINPGIFLELQVQTRRQWQVVFYTDKYKIRVSSHGTVSIYETDDQDQQHEIRISPKNQW